MRTLAEFIGGFMIGLALMLALWFGHAHGATAATNHPVTASAAAANAITCHRGIYGLGGDWGAFSLLANTQGNRTKVHRRYGYGKTAYRIIHNVTPPACR